MTLRRAFTGVALAALVAACGPAGQPSNVPGATPTPGVPAAGQPIGANEIEDAARALEAKGAWQFAETYFAGGGETGFEFTVTGTERFAPARAVDAVHTSANGEFHYIRIGDDIYVDLATDQWTKFDAGESENLIDQYEPVHLAGLLELADSSTLDFDPVGTETINGIATTHYTLDDGDREDQVQMLEIEPSDWAGEVYLAVDGGYLVGFDWGPQSTANAGPLLGFSYRVSNVGCECPVEPPI